MILSFWIPLACVVILVFFIRGREILFNELFWLLLWWTLVLGNALVSGIYWGYEISIQAIIYVLGAILLFIIGRFFGTRTPRRKTPLVDRKPSEYRIPTILGVCGVLLFTIDYLRLNGF